MLNRKSESCLLTFATNNLSNSGSICIFIEQGCYKSVLFTDQSCFSNKKNTLKIKLASLAIFKAISTKLFSIQKKDDLGSLFNE